MAVEKRGGRNTLAPHLLKKRVQVFISSFIIEKIGIKKIQEIMKTAINEAHDKIK